MRLQRWQQRIIGGVALFLILGLALLVDRYIWHITDSLFMMLAVLILAGFVTGVVFGSGASLYVVAAPALLLAVLSTLEEEFGIEFGLSGDSNAYFFAILTAFWIAIPLVFGARLGQVFADRAALHGIQINWNRLREWF